MTTQTSPVISLRGIGKRYDSFSSPGHRLLEKLDGRSRAAFSTWAVQDIDLDVMPGEAVGIMGRNGSGKSTLLQIIVGTTRPTTGTMQVNGQVSALLELGSGFDPQFTGRENVYINGAIRNLPRSSVDELFEKIADFAAIGSYIDQPVKTYSSGMMVRLAFAAATVTEPEILIIDEALVVGDEAFQRKCISRMERMQAAGATVLLVSHSGRQIIEVCDRAVMLDRGEKICEGDAKSVVTAYHSYIYAPPELADEVRDALRRDGPIPPKRGAPVEKKVHQRVPDFDPDMVPESRVDYLPNGAEIFELALTDETDRRVNLLRRGHRYRIRYLIAFIDRCEDVGAGTLIKTLTGVAIASASTAHLGEMERTGVPGRVTEVVWEFECNLLAGTYFINAGCSGVVYGERRFLHRIIDGLMFQVLPEPGLHMTGIVDLRLSPRVRGIEETADRVEIP
ncbi:MAG: ABC transporter ATP-binding protein [Alphaproteobacteria bacterium]|nr:ABC transporter ATP-binding protein [Alphaproteobacteria bacterium]